MLRAVKNQSIRRHMSPFVIIESRCAHWRLAICWFEMEYRQTHLWRKNDLARVVVKFGPWLWLVKRIHVEKSNEFGANGRWLWIVN